MNFDVQRLAQRSVAVIQENQDHSGAYLASPNFPVYRYSWLRDGAFIADAMSRAGAIESAERFFGWCARLIAARVETIDELISRQRSGQRLDHSDFLHARYTLDGSEGSERWWNFQLDGYGTWLWALDGHARRHRRPVDPYLEGAVASARYIAEFWSQPSFDWWEEHPNHVHTSTLASITAGLSALAGWGSVLASLRELAWEEAQAVRRAILSRAVVDGHLVKWLDGNDVDASLIACSTPFELLAPDDPITASTVGVIEARLAHGGVHRYVADTYYGGGEWILLAALLGWHYRRAGSPSRARAQLDWVVTQADEQGNLPEQVSHHLLAPDRYEEWLERWGPIARPLLWSHAMFLTLAVELGAVKFPLASASG